jgi:hypothetical protein
MDVAEYHEEPFDDTTAGLSGNRIGAAERISFGWVLHVITGHTKVIASA